MNDIVYAGKHFLTYNVSRHKHHNWELVYCTGESGRFIFDDLELPYGVGDIVVIPPELPHKNVSDGGFTNIHLNIDDATLPFKQPALVRDDSNHSIEHLFLNAYYLFCGDLEHKKALLSSYGSLIVQHMIVNRGAHQKNRVAEQIEQSIVQNYADANYKLDEVLRSMPYCYDYLCRLFRKEAGTTPHKYLANLRLQAAANMLSSVDSSGSITEIAHLCGFRNPLYFSRLFKKKHGVSPSEYCQRAPEIHVQPPTDPDDQKIILPE